MTSISVNAPFAGWVSALVQAPDPVFAERMMGDGIVIEPLDGIVCAPCDGIVSSIAPTMHSVSIKLANGADLLIHVGIDTVALRGAGFTPLVPQGTVVSAGTPLLEIDLDSIMQAGKSLVTPIIVINDGFEIVEPRLDRLALRGDRLFEVRAVASAASLHAATDADDHADCEVVIGLANGIHARPAARIVAELKNFDAEISIASGQQSANARSVVGLLGLGVSHGDLVVVKARGPDARAAVAAVVVLIESGMGEAGPPDEPASEAAPAASQTTAGPLFAGVSAAPGLAIGPAFRFQMAEIEVAENADDPAAEAVALQIALRAVADGLANGQSCAAKEIADAHAAILGDPELLAAATAEIDAGRSAARAWQIATRAVGEFLRATGDARLIERTADLTDIEQNVVATLAGSDASAISLPPAGAILIADELLPSQFIALGEAALAGICTARGGPTSHVAILAASANIPMIVAAGPAILSIADGQMLVLDACARTLNAAPDAATIASGETRLQLAQAKRRAELDAANTDCFTADGTRIEVFANLASHADALSAIAAGAEGCGLLRTEFLFLDRLEAPSEAEQRDEYAAIATAMQGRPLIIRTLDIGGDKPVPYLPFQAEDNPALGARGIRLGLARPDILATQLRAIVAAVPAPQCRIMLPMIVDRDEFATVRNMLDGICAEMGVTAHIPLGVMIETPAAALLAHSLAAQADFLSIGTNDLTQYTLAADRGNPAVAARVDALHPAVLRLIGMTTTGAAMHGRWVGVCGGLASDTRAAAILIGLGVTELSVTPAAVPAIKAIIRELKLSDCRALAERATAMSTAPEVRALLGEQ